MIRVLDNLAQFPGYVDTTGATSDYVLKLGETAIVTFSAATSIPLNVACVEGEYEISMISNAIGVAGVVNGYAFLNPNNTTYTSAIEGIRFYRNSGGGSGQAQYTWSAFGFGYGRVPKALIRASTITTAKVFDSNSLSHDTSYREKEEISCVWNDTTTVWSSLGTLVFTMAHTGKVAVRRLL